MNLLASATWLIQANSLWNFSDTHFQCAVIFKTPLTVLMSRKVRGSSVAALANVGETKDDTQHFLWLILLLFPPHPATPQPAWVMRQLCERELESRERSTLSLLTASHYLCELTPGWARNPLSQPPQAESRVVVFFPSVAADVKMTFLELGEFYVTVLCAKPQKTIL